MNNGENGKGLASRWYANTIAERIRAIGRHASRFDFVQDDGLNLVERYKDKQDATFFIAPPHTRLPENAPENASTISTKSIMRLYLTKCPGSEDTS